MKHESYRQIFENIIKYFFKLLSVTFLIARIIHPDIIINVHKYSCIISLLMEYSNET